MSICCEESSWREYSKGNNKATQQFALFLINAEMLMAAFPKSPLSWGTLSFWNAQHQIQNSTSLTNRDCVPAVLSFQVELAVPVKPKSLSVNTRLFLSCPLPAFLLLPLLPPLCSVGSFRPWSWSHPSVPFNHCQKNLQEIRSKQKNVISTRGKKKKQKQRLTNAFSIRRLLFTEAIPGNFRIGQEDVCSSSLMLSIIWKTVSGITTVQDKCAVYCLTSKRQSVPVSPKKGSLW